MTGLHLKIYLKLVYMIIQLCPKDLQYLKSALSGDALRVVKSISISNQNYSVAWSLLEDRFSNRKEQVFAHIKRFMSMPCIQHESSSALLNLVDTTFESVKSLEILEQKIEGFSDTMFVYILLQKLDPATKLWFEREFGKKNELPKLSELIDFLKNYARTLENSKSSKSTNQKYYAKSAVLLTNVKFVKVIMLYISVQNFKKFRSRTESSSLKNENYVLTVSQIIV